MPSFSDSDSHYMAMALKLARAAQDSGEVPVGAVLVYRNRVIGQGKNAPITLSDPTAHAEVQALREAALQQRNYRLSGSTLYSTLEPCVMCAGAIVLARVDRLVFGARDLRFGAVRSKFSLADSMLLNHRVTVEEGLLAVECGELLASFFRQSRSREESPR